MLRTTIFLLLSLCALPAQAERLRNAGQFGIALRAGPGVDYPLMRTLDPGAEGETGACDRDGRWCLLTTRGGSGWVDTFGMARPDGAPPPVEEARPLRDAPIESTPLDGPARPLPPSILDAVNGAGGRLPPVYVPSVPVPGARPPRLLSTFEPFRNVTDGEVNLRAGPGAQHPIVGRLRPGEGGPLDVCDPSEQWCRIAAPGLGPAWVKMTLMGLRRL